MHAPFLQDGLGHRAELLQSKLADAGQQFLARDVADLSRGRFGDGFLGIIQRFADKQVGVAVIARVFGLNL